VTDFDPHTPSPAVRDPRAPRLILRTPSHRPLPIAETLSSPPAFEPIDIEFTECVARVDSAQSDRLNADEESESININRLHTSLLARRLNLGVQRPDADRKRLGFPRT
jgi:hypothetical protein